MTFGWSEKLVSDSAATATSSPTQQLTAADFNLYAPRIIAEADINKDGLTTREELMQEKRAVEKDPQMANAGTFLLDHYAFLESMSQPVAKEAFDEHPTRGISLETIKNVSNVLNGTEIPSYEQFAKSYQDAPTIAAVGGVAAGMLGVGALGGAAADWLMFSAVGLASGAVGLVALVAGAGWLAYKAGRLHDQHQYKEVGARQYERFLADIRGTEGLREKLFPVGSAVRE
jgi:hypothetical protein